MMQRLLLTWLLVVAHARPPTLPKSELLARAATIDAFFQNGTAPDTWTVRSRAVHKSISRRFSAPDAAVAEAEAEDDGDSLVDAAAVASSRRGSGRQHHQCRGRRCRRRQKKKHESGA